MHRSAGSARCTAPHDGPRGRRSTTIKEASPRDVNDPRPCRYIRPASVTAHRPGHPRRSGSARDRLHRRDRAAAAASAAPAPTTTTSRPAAASRRSRRAGQPRAHAVARVQGHRGSAAVHGVRTPARRRRELGRRAPRRRRAATARCVGGGRRHPPAGGARRASQLGVAYRRNTSKAGEGFDCSGLTTYAWAQAGVTLVRQSAAQIRAAAPRTWETAQAGDLVYYPGHVSMYLGVDRLIVHSPYTGRNVEVDHVPKRLDAARRPLGLTVGRLRSGAVRTRQTSVPRPRARLGVARTWETSVPRPRARLGAVRTRETSVPRPRARLGAVRTRETSVPRPTHHMRVGRSGVDRAGGVLQGGTPRPVRRAMISAQIETAVSSGVRAPRSRPIGDISRCESAVGHARLAQALASACSCVVRLPITPM